MAGEPALMIIGGLAGLVLGIFGGLIVGAFFEFFTKPYWRMGLLFGVITGTAELLALLDQPIEMGPFLTQAGSNSLADVMWLTLGTAIAGFVVGSLVETLVRKI